VLLVLEIIVQGGLGEGAAGAQLVDGHAAVALLLKEHPALLQNAFGLFVV